MLLWKVPAHFVIRSEHVKGLSRKCPHLLTDAQRENRPRVSKTITDDEIMKPVFRDTIRKQHKSSEWKWQLWPHSKKFVQVRSISEASWSFISLRLRWGRALRIRFPTPTAHKAKLSINGITQMGFGVNG